MPRRFSSEEEKKAWGQKMKELRAKKKAEREKDSSLNSTSASSIGSVSPTIPAGYVQVKHQSGDILIVPEWLANDLIQRGEAEKI